MFPGDADAAGVGTPLWEPAALGEKNQSGNRGFLQRLLSRGQRVREKPGDCVIMETWGRWCFNKRSFQLMLKGQARCNWRSGTQNSCSLKSLLACGFIPTCRLPYSPAQRPLTPPAVILGVCHVRSRLGLGFRSERSSSPSKPEGWWDWFSDAGDSDWRGLRHNWKMHSQEQPSEKELKFIRMAVWSRWGRRWMYSGETLSLSAAPCCFQNLSLMLSRQHPFKNKGSWLLGWIIVVKRHCEYLLRGTFIEHLLHAGFCAKNFTDTASCNCCPRFTDEEPGTWMKWLVWGWVRV